MKRPDVEGEHKPRPDRCGVGLASGVASSTGPLDGQGSQFCCRPTSYIVSEVKVDGTPKASVAICDEHYRAWIKFNNRLKVVARIVYPDEEAEIQEAIDSIKRSATSHIGAPAIS